MSGNANTPIATIDTSATDAGANAFSGIAGMTGTEGLSKLFSYELDVMSPNANHDFSKFIGKKVTITIDLVGQTERYINGIISSMERVMVGTGTAGASAETRYRIEVVPDLWLLTLIKRSRIFHDKEVWEIVEEVLGDSSIVFTNEVNKSSHYPTRTYTVQYNESDFDFVSRLMEDEGIYYYFTHTSSGGTGSHTMVIADGSATTTAAPTAATDGSITNVQIRQTLGIRTFQIVDYDFTDPNNVRSGEQQTAATVVLAPASTTCMEHPGGNLNVSEGTRRVTLRAEAEEAKAKIISGASTRRAFSAGFQFEDDTAGTSPLPKYRLVSVKHTLQQPSVLGGGSGAVGAAAAPVYSNTFECIPLDLPFRPQRVTPWPAMRGPQTAIVVGSSATSTDVYTNTSGQVKVRFPWMDSAANSSWLRVSQEWAGNDWGGMHLPHPGQEVIVDFLDGDPDRPVVTGRVYNGANATPKTPKGANGQWDTNLSIHRDKFGNEMVLDSTSGKEKVRLYSPRGDSKMEVGSDGTSLYTKNKKIDVAGANSLTVGLGHTFAASGGSTFKGSIGFNFGASLGGSYDLYLGYKASTTIGPSWSYQRGRSMSSGTSDNYQAWKGHNIQVSEKTLNLVGGALTGGNNSILFADDDELSLSVGKNDNKDQSYKAGRMKAAIAAASVTSTVLGVVATIVTEVVPDEAQYKDVHSGVSIGVTGFETIVDGLVAAIFAGHAALSKSKPATPVTHGDATDEVKSRLFLSGTGGTGKASLRATDEVALSTNDDAWKGTDKKGPSLTLKKAKSVALLANEEEKADTGRLLLDDQQAFLKGNKLVVISSKSDKVKITASKSDVIVTASTFKATKNLTVMK